MSDDTDLRGVIDPDFLALGLGGTNMMAMLWTVACGRRAVGVEMRGDPFLGVHWNIRVDLYHQLGLIDRMMLDRYGEGGVPRRADGRLFSLADCFYGTRTVAGDIVADEIIDGYDALQHIVGTIHHVEFIDDRWKDGVPNRVVTLLQPPAPPDRPDAAQIRTDMTKVLDGPSMFQAGAASVLVLLRRYLERLEEMDLESGRDMPRVRLFTRHRVVEGDEGFVTLDDGRRRIRIEALQELDFRRKFVRIRKPGSDVIDIGVPELFVIAEGAHSNDATRLGFEQSDVVVDHHDGRGPVVAQADFLAGLVEVLVGGRLRRRISSEFNADGKEYWVRQIAVGHENDPEVGWVLVQVPDFKTFDPIEAGLVPAGTDPESAEFFAAFQQLVYDFYIQQSADILELPAATLAKAEMVYGPKLFSLVERMGKDALVAPNGVVAGDSFGNGHFLTSGGAMTGMIGHSAKVLRYWQDRDAGVAPEVAIRQLADGIKEDTHAWLNVSAREYSEAIPINFGAERIRQITAGSGVDARARAAAIDAPHRRRHALLPLDPSDWRRLFLRNGAVLSAPLPELHAIHPALRAQRPARRAAMTTVVYVAASYAPSELRWIRAVLGQPGVRMALVAPAAAADLPEAVSDRIAARVEVGSLDSEPVADAISGLIRSFGAPGILLGTARELQATLGEVRDRLRLPGMPAATARRFVDKALMKQTLRDAGLPVAEEAVDDPTRGEGTELRIDVMCIGGVPAWFSATRRDRAPLDGSKQGAGWSAIVLPREPDDPADAKVRRLAFAALKALGASTGLSSIRWARGADGRAVVRDVEIHPPSDAIIRLMGHAHDADMHQAWANAVVNGLFVPIPRQYAAGAVLFEWASDANAGVEGLDQVRRKFADLVVDEWVPPVGVSPSEPQDRQAVLMFRHRETDAVEQALRYASTMMRVTGHDYALKGTGYSDT